MAVDPRNLQAYLIAGLIGIFGIVSYFLVFPVLYYLLGAVVLVYVSYPLYRHIESAVGNESAAAFLALTVLMLIAVIPTIFMAERVITQGQDALVGVGMSTTAYIDTGALEQTILELTGKEVDVETTIREAFVEAGRMISRDVPEIISTLFDAVIGLFVMAVTMYYLFKEGDDILSRVRELVPLEEEQKEKLLTELDRMSEAVLVGHLLAASIQGAIAGIGLWAVGIPNVFFWTAVMVLLSIIPLVGSFLVWGPAALYLIFPQGQLVQGIALLVYGTVVVGLTDNLVRMKVVEDRGKIHPLLVLIGVIGGLSLFGLIGVILGPLVLGFFITLLKAYKEDFMQV